ncbi:hypothetical protein PSHT_12095, partial [Puccinia striiformis]
MCQLSRDMKRSGGYINDSDEFMTPTEVKLVKMKPLLIRILTVGRETGGRTTAPRPQLGSTIIITFGRGHPRRNFKWLGDREPTDRALPARSQSAARLSSVGIHVSKANCRHERRGKSVRWADVACSIFWAHVAPNDDQESRLDHRCFFLIFDASQRKRADIIQQERIGSVYLDAHVLKVLGVEIWPLSSDSINHRF